MKRETDCFIVTDNIVKWFDYLAMGLIVKSDSCENYLVNYCFHGLMISDRYPQFCCFMAIEQIRSPWNDMVNIA